MSVRVPRAFHEGRLTKERSSAPQDYRNALVLAPVGIPQQTEGHAIKTTLALTACLAFGLLANVSPVEAKGCIKGAIVGGVAGKMAGHGKVGAAAGCAVGHSKANKKG